jgi:hypothetical protein
LSPPVSPPSFPKLSGWSAVRPTSTAHGPPATRSSRASRRRSHRALRNRLTGMRRFLLAAGRLCALAVWVYRQRGGAPRLNRGKMGRMQAASGKELCGRSARLTGRVWRDGQ